MQIFLVRHGEQKYPYDKEGKKMVSGVEAPLVDLGRFQMRGLKKEFEGEGIFLDAVFRSPHLRTGQSADELVGNRLVPIHIVDDLKEVFPNSAEGHTYEELEAIGGDIYAHPFNPNQETLDHLVERQKAALEFILTYSREERYNFVGIVGHGDPLCAFNWTLKHKDLPSSYDEMKESYYPQKGQALEYVIDSNLELVGKGRLITTEAAKQTFEEFRTSRGLEQEL